MIWSKAETLARSELRELQSERLRKTVGFVYDKVPFYRRRLDEAGITAKSIESVEDLARLPFTNKDDLRQNYPFGLFAVPLRDIVRIHASSGTTGQSTVVGYSAKDIKTWAELMARTLAGAGCDSDDIVHNAYGYGLFTGGLGIHYGAELMEASVIPISGGNTKRQVRVMADFGSTILACTPSYALYLAEAAEEMGVSIDSLQLKSGIFGAEPWSDNMRSQIEAALNIKALDIYGLSEIIGPGVAFECMEQDGLHVAEDHFIVEVIDPDTGHVLPPGALGELVFTTITKEGIPLLRYRTRDISCLSVAPCACGRTVTRMQRVTGRTDDMLIIRGVNVFPSQIESALMEIDGTEPHYLLTVDRKGGLDILEVQVEVAEELFSDEIRRLEELSRTIKNEIESILNISISVKLVEPKTIQRSEGKAKRVIDKRTI